MENRLIVPATGEKIEDPADLSASIVTEEKELRKKCRETSEKEIVERKIVERMKEAMKTAWVNGFGLAAIQIGILARMAWFTRPEYIGKKLYPGMGKDIVLINPVIVEKKKPFIYVNEGCLSLPQKTFNTQRYQEVTLTSNSFDMESKKVLGIKEGDSYTFKGLEAVICLHEIDHMDGILCSDKAYKKMPGRNEPCPCQSGKKYKKCCLK